MLRKHTHTYIHIFYQQNRVNTYNEVKAFGKVKKRGGEGRRLKERCIIDLIL